MYTHALQHSWILNYRRITQLCLIATLLIVGACADSETDNAKQSQIHLTASTSYKNQGQFRAAIIEARNVIKYAPDSVDGYLIMSDIYNQLGRGKLAIELLTTVTDKFPAETSLPLATAYQQSGKFLSALETLKNPAITEATRQSSEYQLVRATAQAGLKQYKDAAETFEAILQQDPGNSEAQLGLIKLSLIQGDANNAKLSLDKLLAQYPNDPEILLVSAQLAYKSNDLEGAEEYLSTALQYVRDTDIILPIKARILSQLSETLTQLGRPSEGLIYSKILAEANPEAHQANEQLNQVLAYLQSGDMENAEALLTDLYDSFPNNTVSGALLGMLNYQQGDLAAADQLLDQNIDVETSPTNIIGSSALTKLKLNQPQQAVELLEQALKNHPEDASINSLYGIALLSIDPKDEQGAIALQKALAIDPSKARNHTILARHYLALGKNEQAYAQYKSALAKTPNDSVIAQSYLQTLLSNNEFDQAKLAAKELVENAPGNPNILLLAAKVELTLDDQAAARALLSKAISLDNKNPQLFLAQAQQDMIEKNWASAEKNYRRVIELDNTIPLAYKGLITSYELRNQSEPILTELNTEVEKGTASSSLLSVLAELNGRQGNLDQAETLAKKALDLSPDNQYSKSVAIAIYSNQSQQKLDSGDFATARSKLFQAMEIGPDNTRLLYTLISIEIGAKNYAEAIKIAEQVGDQSNDRSLSEFLKGRIYAAQQQWPTALKHLQDAWDIQPSNAVAALLHKATQETGGDADAFLDVWQQAIPDSAQPLSIKAIAYHSAGKASQAIELYQQALKLSPSNSMVLNNLAWLYFEASDSRAKELAEKAYNLSPNNAGILDTYGWILANSGETTKGVELLEQANKLAPDSKEIQSHLEQAKTLAL